MKIVISAGHNPGTDSGAVGQGQYESNENVRIADRVVLYLRGWGIDTDYMPNDVGDLQSEINWMNARYADGSAYGIQIHRNAGGGTGNEVWTTSYKNQIPLASAILNAMTEITKLPSRGVKDIKTSNWPLGWINYVNCESVLIEARFIDRDDISDASDMIDAYAIACGIADFLGVKRGNSIEQDAINAAQVALEAQRTAKIEADKKAAEAEVAKIAAENAAKVAETARLEKLRLEAEAKIATDAKKKADDSVIDSSKDAIKKETELNKQAQNENIQNILQLIIKVIKELIMALLAKKGKQ